MKKDIYTQWDGVKNHQAINNLKSMSVNDLAFFYHSGKERSIQGIVKIVKEFYKGIVDVKYLESLEIPVKLSTIKSVHELSDTQLVKQPRLSVCSLPKNCFDIIINLSVLQKSNSC